MLLIVNANFKFRYEIAVRPKFSFRITRLLNATFQKCKHVSTVGLNDKSDSEIWDYAKSNDFVIVTFDADFYDLAVIKGIPPKIIWLRIGNATTLNISHVLDRNKELILDFCSLKNENICLKIV